LPEPLDALDTQLWCGRRRRARARCSTAAREVDTGPEPSDRVRPEGGGRARLIDTDPDLLANLDDLLSPEARDDPIRARGPALCAEHVDSERGLVHVRGKIAESNRGLQHWEAPKNWRHRTSVFSPELAVGLGEWAAAATADEVRDGKGLLFPAPRGGWLSRNNFRQRVWVPATGLVVDWRWSFHARRHCATIATIDRGWDITLVSQLLGHRDVGVTQRIYLVGRTDYATTAAKNLGW
jgi:hypothetical protein